MINAKKKLQIEHLDKKFKLMKRFSSVDAPTRGWIFLVRKTLNISLKQLGNKLNITPQSVKEIEEREQNKSITLKNLSAAADALDMRLIYGLIPKDDSLEKLIERKSYEAANQIVQRTSHSMSLEEQKNQPERIKKAIEDKTKELQQELPRYLWD